MSFLNFIMQATLGMVLFGRKTAIYAHFFPHQISPCILEFAKLTLQSSVTELWCDLLAQMC